MCGIVGYIKTDGLVDREVFGRMRDSLSHRGPDDAGTHYLNDGSIALGHRRLSFLDLSPSGRQPMSNSDGSIWIVFNGEIYNYIELREQLYTSGYTFRTNTDTEVIIAGYERWGIGVLQRLKGMFAFSLVDLRQDKTLLVRDRFGIKPLYYMYDKVKGLIFASELKAILTDPSMNREIDFGAFADYFVYRYIPSPKTIWKGINKLPPATWLAYDHRSHTIETQEYWTVPSGHKKIGEQELVKYFGGALLNSVKQHARSDVPIGSFLSGGYDSSAIVHYLSVLGYRPDVFSIGFEGWAQSEDRYAQLVANETGAKLHTTIVDGSSLALLDRMPDVYDEPIADISIIPTWLVSQLARRQVKAVMSGEGADELLGGYTWQKAFFAASQTGWWHRLKKKMAGEQTSTVDYYAQAMAMGRFDRQELAAMLTDEYQEYIADDTDWFYRQHYDESLSPLQSVQKMDIKCFMGELVLAKIDRASMAHSLEVRVPFLDHEIFEKILQCDERIYFKQDRTKFLLYENIKNVMPPEIMDRSKQGFVGPDRYYMDIDWYKGILDQSKMISDGIIRHEYYQKMLTTQDHWRLWKMAVMENWYRRWTS